MVRAVDALLLADHHPCPEPPSNALRLVKFSPTGLWNLLPCCPLLIGAALFIDQPRHTQSVPRGHDPPHGVAGPLGVSCSVRAAKTVAPQIGVIIILRRLRLALLYAPHQLLAAAEHTHGCAQQKIIAPLGQIICRPDGAFPVIQPQQTVSQRIQQVTGHFLHTFTYCVDDPCQQRLPCCVLR